MDAPELVLDELPVGSTAATGHDEKKASGGGGWLGYSRHNLDDWNEVVVRRNLERCAARIQSLKCHRSGTKPQSPRAAAATPTKPSLQQQEWLLSLRQEHERVALRAALCAQPLAAWQKLSKVAKFEKTTILTLLQLNQHIGGYNRSVNNPVDFIDELPIPLTEAYFETSVPKTLIHDRDVFLARMDTHHSRLYYTAKALLTTPFNNHSQQASLLRHRPTNSAPSSSSYFHPHRFTNASPQRQSTASARAHRP
jgi:hypothetical protein